MTAQKIYLFVIAVLYNAALAHGYGGFFAYCRVYKRGNIVKRIYTLVYFAQKPAF